MTPERLTVTSVGPVLRACPQTDAVVAVIRHLNEDVQVVDRGSYVRVLVPECCRLTQDALDAATSGTLRLPGDLEALMVSFKGRLELDETAAVWRAPNREGTP